MFLCELLLKMLEITLLELEASLRTYNITCHFTFSITSECSAIFINTGKKGTGSLKDIVQNCCVKAMFCLYSADIKVAINFLQCCLPSSVWF
jgi:hypothetical protein